MACLVVLLWYLVTSAAFQQAHAVEYMVINNASSTVGGARFDGEIGIEYTKQVMNSSTVFIWQIFQESTSEERRDVQKVSVFIEPMDGVAYAVIDTNEIHVSSEYIGNYSGDVKNEITGVLYHEMTHIWQWFANREAPTGLTEGIADFVRLKAGYAPSHWVKPGEGSRWDQGYDVTAHFLDYCDGLLSGFVADMNKKMKSGYSPEYFVELLGKTVDQLWSDYKAKYGN